MTDEEQRPQQVASNDNERWRTMTTYDEEVPWKATTNTYDEIYDDTLRLKFTTKTYDENLGQKLIKSTNDHNLQR